MKNTTRSERIQAIAMVGMVKAKRTGARFDCEAVFGEIEDEVRGVTQAEIVEALRRLVARWSN
jgi:hypothetical protein